MRRSIHISILIFLLSNSFLSADTKYKTTFFEEKIRPLFVNKCYSCHSEEARTNGKLKAGLLLDSAESIIKGGDAGKVLIPEKPEESILYEAVLYKDEDIAMPPKGKLTEIEIANIKEWILMGAPWPGENTKSLIANEDDEEPYDWEKFRNEHWAFKKVSNPIVPKVEGSGIVVNPIDNFIFDKLGQQGIKPNKKASKNILIRRAYLTLIGIPPTPNQVQNFIEDTNPDAFSKVIDELLNSKHYGEKWARHWLDVARYSDGHGGFGDNKALPNAWRYRDWVIDSFNSDLPYDQFVTQQIAGDLHKENSQPIPTGFFVVGPSYTSDGGDPEAKAQALAETLSDRVDTFSRAFLGLTAACSRCHDHKFDPITIKDYYALAGIFKNTRNVDVKVGDQNIIDSHNSWQNAINDTNKKISTFLENKSKELKVDKKEVEKSIDEESKKHISYLRQELESLKKSEPEKPGNAHVLAESGNADMHVALRGDLRKKGEIAPRSFIEIIEGKSRPKYSIGSGRLELAKSVVAENNPLTSRVIVNRLWGWHFGNGIVRTPSNFGVIGEKPTHPQLLDWLAYNFVENGWSIKKFHKLVMLSSTWQMSSEHNDKKFNIDGDNKLLWRFQPKKLEVESWRDSILYVTNELDQRIGGPPEGEIMTSQRRTLYATISRTGDKFKSDGFLRLFDFPAAASTSPKRASSTVPQQYLFMLNSVFMNNRAKTLGRFLSESNLNRSKVIENIYNKLYSRPPQASEVEIANAWLGESPDVDRWSLYAQALLSAHEMIQIR